ncbi:MAG: hypothetical protein LBE16_09080 [Clostridiales Family XIII bacterium]|jgi:hypothetical protein|nr:hypothetical protein [Clostridiales Family XIII bacterium]
MTVYSPTTEYIVLTRVGFDKRRLIARDAWGNTRLLVIVESAREARRLTPLLLDFRDNAAFSDFIEFFPDRDGLVAVFAYRPDGADFDNILTEAPNPLRAAVLRSLFAQILSQSLPEAMLREVLRPENLLISASGQVRFFYGLPREAEAADDIGISLSDAVKRIAGEGTAPAVSDFAERLKLGAFGTYAEMYAAADDAAGALSEFVRAPAFEKRSLKKAGKEAGAFAKQLTARRVTILAAAVLIMAYAAVGALFYRSVIDPPRTDNNIRSIGTVVVTDGS